MSLWLRNGASTSDLLAQLYEDQDDEQMCEYEFSDSGDESDGPVYHTRTPSPASPRSPSRRERSRSPVWQPKVAEPEPEPLEVVVSPEDVLLMAEGNYNGPLAPDNHATFISPGQVKAGERSGRGRGRGGRRGRGARRVEVPTDLKVPECRHNYQSHRGHLADVGQPLTEIWKTDEELPPEVVSLDAVKKEETQDADRERNSESRAIKSEKENFSDVHSGTGRLPMLESQNLFEWDPMESFQGKEETFRPVRTGSVQFYTSGYEAFRSYWNEDILEVIVAETNQHATEIPLPNFLSEWYPTNTHEILCLFSFWLMLGVIKMPTIPSCFSLHPVLKTDVFRRVFTQKRYESLIKALNFLDSVPPFYDGNPPDTGIASIDRLHRLRPIITYLNSKFQSNYILDRNIYVDDSFIYIKHSRSKSSRCGIRTFELRESTTGYLWSFIAYSEKSSPDFEKLPDVLKSTAVVKQLTDPLLNQGYRLFINNWYTSPHLARYLKHNGTDCVGTLTPTRDDVPALIQKAPLKRGELVARHSGDVCVLSWQDKKRVTMISTCHGSSSALPRVPSGPLSRPVAFKPKVVLDYNRFMGADLKDQNLEPYLIERERSSLKLLKHLLNASTQNSRILLQSSTHTPRDQLAFRIQLVDDIITYHLPHCPQSKYVRRFSVSSSADALQQPGRILHHTHWPVRLQQTASSLANCRSFRKRCVVCLRQGRRMQKTVYCCEACGVPLCIENCFKTYHTTLS